MRTSNKRRIKFIVNPFAGIGNKKNFQTLLERYLDLNLFEYQVEYTTAPGHGKEIATKAVQENFDIIVAVGGDGSVNEIASVLIDTDKTLGIIPAGSGNGFASHLGYSRNISKSITSLNTAKSIKIDTCTLNEKNFINVAGVGFDAWVAYKIKRNKFRGFFGYLKTALQETFSYQLRNYTIKIDGKTIKRKCLCVEVANATMFGYNMKIAPLAKLDDGLFDVVIIKNASKIRYLLSIFRFPFGNIHKSRIVEYYNAREVEIHSDDEYAVHYDGEGFLTSRNLNFSIKNLSLTVLQPQ